MNKDGGIDRAVQNRGAQTGEHGTAVNEHEVEFAAKPRHRARPAGTGQKVTRAGHGGAKRQNPQVVVWGLDQALGQGKTVLDHVFKTDLGTNAQEAREHRATQVGIDDDRATGPPRQCTGEREHQGRPALRAMTTREEQDLERLPLPCLDQPVGQLLEPLAPFPFQDLNDLRPDEFVARTRLERLDRERRRVGLSLDRIPSRDRCCATRIFATTGPWPVGARRHGRPLARIRPLSEYMAKSFVNFPHGLAPLGCRRAAGSRETRRGPRRRSRRMCRRARSKARWEAGVLWLATSQPGLYRQPNRAWSDGPKLTGMPAQAKAPCRSSASGSTWPSRTKVPGSRDPSFALPGAAVFSVVCREPAEAAGDEPDAASDRVGGDHDG